MLVEDDRIKEVADRPIGGAAAARVDLRGRTLMPGLIDAHIHILLPEVNLHFLDGVPLTLLAAKGSVSARAMLMRGFTSVRDTGGADYGMKAAIAEWPVPGPRLSSRYADQPDRRHGDFRKRTQTGFECACCSASPTLRASPTAFRSAARGARRAARAPTRQDHGLGGSPAADPPEPQYRMDETRRRSRKRALGAPGSARRPRRRGDPAGCHRRRADDRARQSDR